MKQRRHRIPLTGLALAGVALVYTVHPAIRGEINAALRLVATADIAPMRDYLLALGWWAPIASTLLQIVTSIFAPLPSFMLAFANAMLFGVWWGGLLTWSSALVAATLCFFIARGYGRPAVERLVPRGAIDSADGFFVRHGVFAVLAGRVLPFVNPDVVSYGAGLTVMRWRLFIASTAVGSLPSTVLYTYLGSLGITSVGWLFTPLVVLGILAALFAVREHYREPVAKPTPSAEEMTEAA